MPNKFLIVANAKQNPLPKYDFIIPENVEVAVAPQLADIPKLKNYVRAAQNVENNAQELKDLGVKYCLVGHSYYRNNFKETNEIAFKKINQLKEVGIMPILCARNEDELQESPYIMFEPEEAISTNGVYHPATNVNKTLENWKSKFLNTRFLYGGSVNENFNFKLLNFKLCEGLVVGHASLDPQSFSTIIEKCHQCLISAAS